MMPSIISRYIVLVVLVLSHNCVGGLKAIAQYSDFDNENHGMLRRQELAQDFDFKDDYLQRRELWGFSNMLCT